MEGVSLIDLLMGSMVKDGYAGKSLKGRRKIVVGLADDFRTLLTALNFELAFSMT
jgi:hypothetical protein